VTPRGPWTPGAAWAKLARGNERFVAGEYSHPNQDAARRDSLTGGQTPFAVFFGCADSRVAAEIIFDQGLGDVFVVRTAGHVIDTTVLGSIEYGVTVAGASLVVVVGHDRCGAIGAAVDALRNAQVPPGFVWAVVDRVIPSIIGMDWDEPLSALDPERLGTEHVRHTVQMLTGYSGSLAERVQAGTLAIVGVEYALADGRIRLVQAAGEIGA
jgi:carbonic anhydrase